MGEQLPRILVKYELLCEPVAKTHGKCTFNLTHINVRVDTEPEEANLKKIQHPA